MKLNKKNIILFLVLGSNLLLALGITTYTKLNLNQNIYAPVSDVVNPFINLKAKNYSKIDNFICDNNNEVISITSYNNQLDVSSNYYNCQDVATFYQSETKLVVNTVVYSAYAKNSNFKNNNKRITTFVLDNEIDLDNYKVFDLNGQKVIQQPEILLALTNKIEYIDGFAKIDGQFPNYYENNRSWLLLENGKTAGVKQKIKHKDVWTFIDYKQRSIPQEHWNINMGEYSPTLFGYENSYWW